MTPFVLIDSGPIIAYYNSGDKFHHKVKHYLETEHRQLVTTCPCITEVLYVLRSDFRVQNELLLDLAKGLYHSEPLYPEDYSRIAELNIKYSDVPGDFADLSLVAISERLGIETIASLDSDFEIYKRYGKKHFKQTLPKS